MWESLREFQESAREEGRAEGIVEGESKGKAISVYTCVKHFVDSTDYTLEEALELLELTEEDYIKGKAMVQQQESNHS